MTQPMGPQTPTAEVPAQPGVTQAEMQGHEEQERRGWRRPVAALAGFGLLIGGAVGLYKILDGDDTSSGEWADILTVDEAESNCNDIVTSSGTVSLTRVPDTDTYTVAPRMGSTLPVDSQSRTHSNRLFSDSVNNPMTSNPFDKEALELELDASLCENADLLAMAGNYFANMEVDGVKVVDLNPWLEDFEGDASGINDDAKELFPGYGENAEDLDVDDAVEAHEQHQRLAALMATLINRFENLGLQDHTTTLNYNVVAGSLSVSDLPPEFQLNPTQYSGRFLTFSLTRKDGTCAKVTLVNLDDQRIAEAEGVCAQPIAPTNPEVPAEVPSTTGTTGTTGTTRPEFTTTTTLRDKDPSQDQKNNQGSPNAGGGSGGTPGPEGSIDPVKDPNEAINEEPVYEVPGAGTPEDPNTEFSG